MSTAVKTDMTLSAKTGPPVAHCWCTCYERDGILPIPSLCGQSHRDRTPEGEAWPTDRMACALCSVLQHEPCPRCGGSE